MRASDKNNVAGTKSFTVKITQTTVTGTFTAGTLKKALTVALKATGGTASYTWSIIKGVLPTGLTINNSTGKITGTPTKAGTYSFTVRAIDKNKVAGTKAFTVKITSPIKAAMIETEEENYTAINEDTSTPNIITQSPALSPEAQPQPESGSFSVITGATLKVISEVLAEGTDRDEGLVDVRAYEPVTFQIGEWSEDVSNVQVIVDYEVFEGVSISDDGTFTLPAEMIHGGFSVKVRAETENYDLESEELNITAE